MNYYSCTYICNSTSSTEPKFGKGRTYVYIICIIESNDNERNGCLCITRLSNQTCILEQPSHHALSPFWMRFTIVIKKLEYHKKVWSYKVSVLEIISIHTTYIIGTHYKLLRLYMLQMKILKYILFPSILLFFITRINTEPCYIVLFQHSNIPYWI